MLETTTQFPVDPGCGVEVTCSETGSINSGSSEVTCTFATYFTYQEEPNCVKPGKFSKSLGSIKDVLDQLKSIVCII